MAAVFGIGSLVFALAAVGLAIRLYALRGELNGLRDGLALTRRQRDDALDAVTEWQDATARKDATIRERDARIERLISIMRSRGIDVGTLYDEWERNKPS